MQYSVFETAWGFFGFVTRGKRLVATFLPRRAQVIQRAISLSWSGADEAPNLLPRFRRQVINYFAGKARRFDVEIDLTELPPFRQAVLTMCRKVPYGKTASYADLARAVGKAGAARAVGGAMAGNPLPLVIPCHRVLRSDGSLGGFSSPQGTKEKKRMLILECACPDVQADERVKYAKLRVVGARGCAAPSAV